MSHLVSVPHAVRLEPFSLAIILPRLVIIGYITLVGIFGIMVASVKGMMHFADTPPNPFNDYADVFPGQLPNGLDARGWLCTSPSYSYFHDPLESHCNLYLSTGTFSEVNLVHIRGVVHETNFMLRNGTMRVADLATLLNISELHARSLVLFKWRGYIGIANIENPSEYSALWRQVRQVTLTDTCLP